MKSKIIILSAKSWSMTDEKTGEERSGTSIQYITNDTLNPAVDSVTGQLGYVVAKQSITTEQAAKLEAVPGLYDASFEMRASGGKNILYVSGIDFVKPIK